MEDAVLGNRMKADPRSDRLHDYTWEALMHYAVDFQAIASFTDTALRGSRLSSVEFIMDYLRLTFGIPWLTVTRWPRVVHGCKTFRFVDPGYRDAICALIGQSVSKVYFTNNDKTFVVEFDDKTLIEIPLDDPAFLCLEAIMFRNTDGQWWVI